jgi:HptB-dependent secretion and biofilm anti anti-sigma factor
MSAVAPNRIDGDVSVERNAERVLVKITGRFVFGLHKKFRNAWLGSPSGQKFVIDMARVEYMDSAAMGMLLVLRDQVGGDDANIELINCPPMVLKLLQIANFQSMFKLS